MNRKGVNNMAKREDRLPLDLEESLDSLRTTLDAEAVEEDKKKEFKIACDWAECGEICVEATSLEEAIRIAESDDNPLPDGEYIDGSFQVNREVTELLQKENFKFR